MAKKSKTTAIVIGVVAVAAVGGLAYWWYKKNKNGATKSAATAPTTQVPVIVIPTSTTTGTVSGAAAATQTTALTPATPIAAVQGEARPITGVSSLPTITIPSVGTLGPQLQLVPATTSGGEYQLVYKTKTGRMVVGEVGQY